ncbi:hypothetical protein ACFDTO_07660 [Microbacteriaceae bacterium 4G12]
MVAPTGTADAESEQRWAAARGLAEGVPDRRMSGRRWRLFALLLAVAVAGGISGGLLPSTRSFAGGSGSEALPGSDLAGYVLVAIGFAIGVVGFIWAKRTGRYILRWRQAISPLNRRERKWVIRQLRGKREPDLTKMDILLAIAKQSRSATEGVLLLHAAPALMMIGLAIATDLAMLRWLHLLAAGLFLLAAVLMAIDYRRWGAFIDKHDEVSHPSTQ